MSSANTRLDPGLLRARLIAVLTVIMLAVVGMFGVATLSAFDNAIAPELENRTTLIGSILRDEIQHTLDLGIPFEALGGLDSYIQETISNFDEIQRIAIVDANGGIVAEVRREERPSLLELAGLGNLLGVRQTAFAFPVLLGNEVVGGIQVEENLQFVENKLRNVFLDVLVLAIVALLLGVELSLAVAAASIWKPYGRVLHLLAEQVSGCFTHTIRDTGVSAIRRVAIRLNEHAEDLAERWRAISPDRRKSLERRGQGGGSAGLRRLGYSDFNDVRLALFVFATGTEITASFLPVYARQAAHPGWLSPELSAAAPLAVYLIAVAAMSPFGGELAKRFGARRIFVLAAIPSTVALAGMGLTNSLVAITLWRGVIGVFYALATIACQEYSIRASGAGEAGQSASAFVGMIFGGAFCGSVLGGVIAGRFGFPVALYFGAAMVLIGGAIALSAMQGRAGDATEEIAQVSADGTSERKGNAPALAALVLCVAMPMSATTAIFIWYFTPLSLTAQGYLPADVARVVMVYYLASTVIGPVAKGLSSRSGGSLVPIVAGIALSGITLLYFRSADGFWVVFAAVSGAGIGHALIRAPMTTLALGLSGGSGNRLGGLRLGERIGALLGLSASALFLDISSPEVLLALLGSVSLVGGFIFAIVLRSTGNSGGEET